MPLSCHSQKRPTLATNTKRQVCFNANPLPPSLPTQPWRIVKGASELIERRDVKSPVAFFSRNRERCLSLFKRFYSAFGKRMLRGTPEVYRPPAVHNEQVNLTRISRRLESCVCASRFPLDFPKEFSSSIHKHFAVISSVALFCRYGCCGIEISLRVSCISSHFSFAVTCEISLSRQSADHSYYLGL